MRDELSPNVSSLRGVDVVDGLVVKLMRPPLLHGVEQCETHARQFAIRVLPIYGHAVIVALLHRPNFVEPAGCSARAADAL
jgi:hypothetical protein